MLIGYINYSHAMFTLFTPPKNYSILDTTKLITINTIGLKTI